jgi:CheY-like chemotaxis protein
LAIERVEDQGVRMPTKKPVILAVDDTPSNLIALEAVLDRDFDIVCASSGAQSIEILQRREDIAVVLMDVQMPIMDGYEAASRIKKLAGCADLPIVFITAVYSEDPHVKRGYQAGGVDYFTKPFDPELLRLKMTIYSSFRQRAAVLRERELHIRETEQVLKAGRKLSAVLESLPVGILIADTEGRICQTNDEMARIAKATAVINHDDYGEMLGWWTSGGQGIKVNGGILSRVLTTGRSAHNEQLHIHCFDGSKKTIVASASPLFGAAGEIVGAVVVIKDPTESRLIEEELQSRIARLVSLGIEIEQTVHPS